MSGPPAFTVVTEGFSPTATDRYDLSLLGGISGLTFSRNNDGDEACNLSLDVPVGYDHPGLALGRRLLVYASALPVWQGVMDTPQRGAPWQVSAVGLGPYGAQDASAVFSTNPASLAAQSNDVIDHGISRGVLPWWRPANLPDMGVTPPTNPGQVGDYLNLVAAAVGEQWEVDSFGNLTFTTQPTVPLWIVDAIDTPGGISLGDFYTVATAYFWTTSTSPPTITTTSVTNTFWTNLGYRVEKPIDLTAYGPIDPTFTAGLLANLLQMAAPQPTFTGAVTVRRGHLLTPGLVEAELCVARANQMYRFIGVQPNASTGILDIATDIDVIAGETSYSADDDTLTVTPVAATARDLDSILANLLAAKFRQPVTASSL